MRQHEDSDSDDDARVAGAGEQEEPADQREEEAPARVAAALPPHQPALLATVPRQARRRLHRSAHTESCSYGFLLVFRLQ